MILRCVLPGKPDLKPAVRQFLYAALRCTENVLFIERGTAKIVRRGCHQRLINGTKTMPEPDRIIRLKTVLHRSGLSRSTVYRKMDEGTFPLRLKVGINGIGWKESELNRWIADPPAYRAASTDHLPA
jgi:prophage regulatory protein